MRNNTQLGQEGETIAADYLKQHGYEIVVRNYRFKRSEVDIIAKKDGVLIFVEVKLRSSRQYGEPEEAVDNKKEDQVISGAEGYIEEIDWDGPIRFDILTVLKQKSRIVEIRLFKDAFG